VKISEKSLEALQTLITVGEILKQVRTLLYTKESSESTQTTSRDGSKLSKILNELSTHPRLEDIPRRIGLCQQALELVSHKDAFLWAVLQGELGNSLKRSTIINRADNMEQAIDRYSLTLKVFTEKDFPEQWAMTQNNLALAYSDRIRGDRANNIEQAIHHYCLAQKIYTEKDFPEDWAMVQGNLAYAYRKRILGDQSDNIEQAIHHYCLTLKVYTEKDFPEQRAMVFNNLAMAYNDRIRGDRADNIEQSIDYLSLALKVFAEKDFPELWAMTHNNLAMAYNDRIRGDRTDNIEQAIDHCSLALKVRTEKDVPADWAMVQGNLANSYRKRILGNRSDNIEQALYHYSLALKVYTEKDFPEQWAKIQNNLVVAYNERINGDRADNIEQAINHFNQALKVRTEKDFPEQWAMTQNNIAIANCIRSDRADNIEQAIDHYCMALMVYTEKDFPEQWAMTQNNLANAYCIQGDRADNIERAIYHYSSALKVYAPDAFPNECRSVTYSLGNLYLEGRRFSMAKNVYALAISAAELLYKAAIFQSSREAELVGSRGLYRRASYALAQSGDIVKAVEALERGRARGLGLSLARDRADMERVREKDPESFQLYWQMVADLQNLESQERVGVSAEGKASPLLRDLMMQARTRLSEVLERIRCIRGYESFLKEPGWQEITDAVVVGQPLVYLAAVPVGGVALIVHRPSKYQDATVDSVNLDGFSEQRLKELLKIWFDAYGGWQGAPENLRQNKINPDDYLQAKKRWIDAIENVTGQLWQDVMGPIFSRLSSQGAQQVFLIPTGLLSLLPLHAAWQEVDGQRRYLQEMMSVSYVPSARSLAHIRRIACAADSEKLLAVDEPRPVKGSHLPNSHAEVMAISSLYENPQILEHGKATRSAVIQALPGAQVAHFSCHGGANWSDPEKSGLLMANNEMLTVKDLFELHLDGARLATLSACETGVPGTKLSDEVVSLPSAFIRAGFAGAIGSLWTVPDESTFELMKNFYQLWRQKRLTPVQALAEAQKKLHESEKFGHPFYWAAFYMTGV
jgi:CHAT domain-containing protein/signal recognition particle subunit SEC65